jgi:hypothetical protein
LIQAKIFVPAGLSAIVLVAVSGTMMTSGDIGSLGSGSRIVTNLSVAMSASSEVRVVAPL